MTPTTYQKPEIRDSNDNIIQQGSFGKNTALSNATNDGWIDYVANDLEALNNNKADANACLPLTGGTMTGTITANVSNMLLGAGTSGQHAIGGATPISKGSYVLFNGADKTTEAGYFHIVARNNETYKILTGTPNGLLTWNGQNVLTATNYNSYALPLIGGTMTGTILKGNGDAIANTVTNGYLRVRGSRTDDDSGALLLLYGSGLSNGSFILQAGNSDNVRKQLSGNADGRLYWDGVEILKTGIIQAYAGSTSPTGWLLCDGSAVSRTTYARLFEVIGTTYGAGNGSTTFNLPNLTDRFIEGSATVGTVKAAGLPNIEGTLGVRLLNSQNSNVLSTSGAIRRNTEDIGVTNAGQAVATPTTTKADMIRFSAQNSNAIYGNSTTVQPPALTLRYIIKY